MSAEKFAEDFDYANYVPSDAVIIETILYDGGETDEQELIEEILEDEDIEMTLSELQDVIDIEKYCKRTLSKPSRMDTINGLFRKEIVDRNVETPLEFDDIFPEGEDISFLADEGYAYVSTEDDDESYVLLIAVDTDGIEESLDEEEE